jgi:hypothetical protein
MMFERAVECILMGIYYGAIAWAAVWLTDRLLSPFMVRNVEA